MGVEGNLGSGPPAVYLLSKGGKMENNKHGLSDFAKCVKCGLYTYTNPCPRCGNNCWQKNGDQTETITIKASIISGMLKDLRTVTAPKSPGGIDGMYLNLKHAENVCESIERRLEGVVIEALKNEL